MSLHSLTTQERWKEIEKKVPHISAAQKILYDPLTQEQDSKKIFHKNIEAFIGTIKVTFIQTFISHLNDSNY